ncbi:unnamed protein product [Ostreobium quekettii]|uniref:Uncharacterized protein n=1 Tax=Ostreobium quekettii TaxID=121088 RepID=A0A8S1JHB1_9CHLO|nr:unnamed protein product [Ostreobium quekettii]
MDLVVNTVRGTCRLPRVDPSTTVQQLKAFLHESLGTKFEVPDPEHQNLVYKGRKLRDHGGSLSSAGISNGESLAVVRIHDVREPEPPEDTPTPDMAAINTAISEYAKANGLEEKLNAPEEPQPQRRRAVSASADTLGQLQSLIDALEGRLDALVQRETAAVVQGRQEDMAEVQVPEPNSEHMRTLQDMGFSEVLARNALLLCRNNLEPALNWILQHSSDPAADVPIPQEQLRRIYGTPPRSIQTRQADASLIAQLREMGFAQDQATRALLTFNNNVEIAVGWLLRNTGAQEEGPSNQQATSSQEPDQAELQEGEEQGEGRCAEVGDRRPPGEEVMAAHGSQPSLGESGTGVDAEQVPQEGSIADTSQTPSEGFPDVGIPVVSPSGEDVAIGLDVAAPLDAPSLGAVLPTLETPYVPMDDDDMEADPHEEPVPNDPDTGGGGSVSGAGGIDEDDDNDGEGEGGVDLDDVRGSYDDEEEDVFVGGGEFDDAGELNGLDLDDLERILGTGSNAELHPALQQLLTMEGLGPDQLDRISVNVHTLVEAATSLDEMFSSPAAIERMRDMIQSIETRQEAPQGAEEEAAVQPGPSDESQEGES